jgi:TfoX/Sxy family transcriptional regulator of competence genes
MAYDEALAARVRDQLDGEGGLTEQAMFGGLAFMLDGNMAVGVVSRGGLMVRVGPDGAEAALAQPHARVFDMGARPMKGWILVDRPGVESDEDLADWVGRGIDFARSLPPKAPKAPKG